MKQIILLFILATLLFNGIAKASMSYDDVIFYVGAFCYIKYYKFENSDIEIYDRVIGKVLDVIFDNMQYKIVVIDYKADLHVIKLDRIVYIKELKKGI